MRVLLCDDGLSFDPAYPDPEPMPGEALVRVTLAGICNTDLELIKGYLGFRGVLGHEFVGIVEASPDPVLLGQRVVGEINAYCGECPTCLAGRPTHCPHSTTLGISGRDGAFADFLTLPAHLLHLVPETIPDRSAVFTEPLAAALQIPEQVALRPTDRVVVLGDGKLGLLVAQVLALSGCHLLAVGRHDSKLDILRRRGIAVRLAGYALSAGEADIVVECTGSSGGFAAARHLLRPRGTLVLKSTYHGLTSVDLSSLVVDEIAVVGSRCGPFAPALRLLAAGLVDVEPFVDAVYPLDEGLAAFQRAATPGILKVLLSMD